MLTLQKICEHTNDNNSQPKSTSDSINSVSDSETKISLTYQNEKKRLTKRTNIKVIKIKAIS